MLFDPQTTYVHLADGGKASRLPGGTSFWSLPESEMSALADGWLVSEFEFTVDWTTWEMHPNGDEFVYLLSGSIDLLLEQADGVRTVAMRGTGAVVVPRGIWHTGKIKAPSRVLHVTRGAGTETRPVASHHP